MKDVFKSFKDVFVRMKDVFKRLKDVFARRKDVFKGLRDVIAPMKDVFEGKCRRGFSQSARMTGYSPPYETEACPR
jgi:hypothetical protein